MALQLGQHLCCPLSENGVVAVLSVLLEQTDLVLIALEQTPAVGVVEALPPGILELGEFPAGARSRGRSECRRSPSRCSPSSSARSLPWCGRVQLAAQSSVLWCRPSARPVGPPDHRACCSERLS
jgi:hypothetical protein